jgi:isoquinoline 1-oxidoreductase beta subunit
MRNIENVSRRGFLKGVVGTSAFVLAVRYVPPILAGEAAPDGQTEADRATLHPNVLVGIETDGTVHIVAHRSEMTGSAPLCH